MPYNNCSKLGRPEDFRVSSCFSFEDGFLQVTVPPGE
jgi:hypothetical protein